MPYMEQDATVASMPPSKGVKDAFQILIRDLSAALGPSSGLDSDDVDPLDIQKIMENYTSDSNEWNKYALADTSKTYTRNLVDEGNGKSNLLVIVWSPGKGSAIHDHANAHCVMKILKGPVKETLYTWPDQDAVKDGKPSPLAVTRETVYEENEVTYMSDKLGLHKISNASPQDLAVSLHLYTPPHAANFGFDLFDRRTGKSSHIKQANFFSRHGMRL